MSYQTEERYWTDYVRVAIPIVGLLLLLGVFWYWARSLIGDNSNNPPATQAAASVTVITQPTQTPTPTVEITLVPETAVPSATEGAAEPTPTPGGEEATETPTEEAGQATQPAGTGFCEGCTVTVHVDDSVRMRSQPSLSGDVIESLTNGIQLVVVDANPQEGDGYTWYHVKNGQTGNDGWVVQDYLVPAS